MFRFVKEMREWTFSTTTRSIEIINIALLAQLVFAIGISQLSSIQFTSLGLSNIHTTPLIAVLMLIALLQTLGLLTDSCSRCRKVSGALLALSAMVWLTTGTVMLYDDVLADNLKIRTSFAIVYYVAAVLCYLAAEFIREYIKARME